MSSPARSTRPRCRAGSHERAGTAPIWPGTPTTGTAPPTPDSSGEFRLYLLCTPDGIPIIREPANPKLGEREVTEALLHHDRHLIQPGQAIIGDKGFADRELETFTTDDLGTHLIRPDRKDTKPRFGKLGQIRQWIESVFDTLKDQPTLKDHDGKTIASVYPRVTARLLTLTATI